jgi:ATP-dependent protease ClpP protease subunit
MSRMPNLNVLSGTRAELDGTDITGMVNGLVLPANLARIAAKHREQAEAFRAQHGIEARSWYRITNQAADEAEVMLYDEIGGWWGATADDFIAELRGITSPKVRVRVNSPGGSVFEGVAIANALRGLNAEVTIQVDGIAASIASVIAMAGDRVVMMPNTTLMIHDASGVCMGNAADMEEMAELLDLISDNIADAYAARAGGTREQWRERMRAETWYLPEDAVESGLADEVMPMPQRGEPEPDMRKTFDLTAYGYQGPRREEPKPEEQTPLTINIGATLDEELVETLRAMVRRSKPAAQTTPVEPAPAVEEPAEEPAPEPEAHAGEPTEPEPAALAAEPVDEWTAITAHLIQDDADDWSALVANLIQPEASSRAATDA